MTEELSEEAFEDAATDSPAESTDDPADDRSCGRTSGDDGQRCESRADDHLQDLPDGSGCTEIWEHIAERRNADD